MAELQNSNKKSERTSIVYFGTPEYAVPALVALANDPRFAVRLVVTQPDRPAGRGHTLHAPAVKIAANELGLPVYQPASLRTAELREPITNADADLFVVAAYGIIFGSKTLAMPRRGCINLHASLLPKYRGASPISAAILAGDEVTGVTLMLMDAGMDTGAILKRGSLRIECFDTTESLTERLALLGAELIVDVIPRWISNEIEPVPQSSTGASAVRPMTKNDGWIDWNDSTDRIERQSRAMRPWPRCWTTLPDGGVLQVGELDELTESVPGDPGTVHVVNKQVVVACGESAVRLRRVQIAGAKEMDSIALINGRKLVAGEVLGAIGAPLATSPLIRQLESQET